MIIDDTHCYKDYLIWFISEIRNYTKNLDKPITIELVDFDVVADICIDRNDKRDAKVDKTMIYHMINMKKEIDFTKLDIDLYTKI